jgi:hypothetical protein
MLKAIKLAAPKEMTGNLPIAALPNLQTAYSPLPARATRRTGAQFQKPEPVTF